MPIWAKKNFLWLFLITIGRAYTFLSSSITSELNSDIQRRGASAPLPFRLFSGCVPAVLFFYTRIFLDRLGRYGGRGLRAISHLRVSGRSGDDTLRFATGHADRNATDQ